MGRRQRAIDDLRLAVACLPHHTKVAMLEGVRAGRIIAGAYTDGDGGACPMLAAHRRGGRTDMVAFARAWDRFTGVRERESRAATPRELRVLEAQLEGTLLAEDVVDLGGAVAAHQATARERRAREAARTGRDWLHGSPGPSAPAEPEPPCPPGGGPFQLRYTDLRGPTPPGGRARRATPASHPER